MSARRTRSGTPLGCPSEPRRLRQTPSRKQHKLKISGEKENHSAAACQDAKAAPGREEPVKPVKKSSASTQVQNAGLNIWERLESGNTNLMGMTDSNPAKEAEEENTSSEPETSSVLSSSHALKKGRKPEILLSLLEGETLFPNNHAKAADASKLVKERKSEEEGPKIAKGNNLDFVEQKRTSREESVTSYTFPTSHSICFFPNCEHHGSESATDFMHIPDVPGEPFFVSLSKDKNKELNMVKTSSGLVRVGCGLRNFLPSAPTFADPYTRESAFGSHDKTVVVRNVSRCGHDPKPVDRSGSSLCPSEARVHVVRLDNESKRGWAQKPGDKQENESQQGKKADGKDRFVHSGVDGCSQGMPWGKDEESKDHFMDVVKMSDLDYKRGPYSSEKTMGFVHDPFSPMTKMGLGSKVSQYPLMEEILTDQTFGSFPASGSSAVCIHDLSDLSKDDLKQSKKTVSLLKTSASTLAAAPAAVLSADNEYAMKHVVKRSERIRCKSGVGGVNVHQAVISTMEPPETKLKGKPSVQRMKKKSKTSSGKDDAKKKKKTMGTTKKSSKKSKDAGKAKATMSREVMDAIVQSIEETVSRAREDKADDLNDSTSDDMSAVNSDYSSHHDTNSSYSDISYADQWSDSGFLPDDKTSVGSTDRPLTPNNAALSDDSDLNIKLSKSSHSVATPSKSKKVRKRSPSAAKSKSSSGKKEKRHACSDPSAKRPMDPMGEACDDTGAGTEAGVAALAVIQGKRFRKKTRKAEEAFGDYDVFCDEDVPVKKAKLKRRSSGSDSSSGSSHRRPRRSSQMGGLMTDPVLEEHAFILWASETRSQIELQHPGASTCEVDAVLSSRWCDVTDSVKARFFFRAREAFSDDERHTIRSSTMAELESGAFGDFFSDRDPVFIEFIRLPIDRQRDMLRKWLKFFQKMLPKKEYIEFIVTFKRACGREGATTASGKPKRTRMRCLDPSHYKMLFDMIRLTKPRVLEVYREKKLKEKKMVTDTYGLMLQKLVGHEPWPHLVTGCRSQLLTEILLDLDIPDQEEKGVATNNDAAAAANLDNAELPMSMKFTNTDEDDDINSGGRNDEELCASFSGRDAKVCITVVNKMPQILEFKLEHGANDVSFEESDYSVLTTDLALNLLSGLNEMKELPVLEQQLLDQVFLAPPRLSLPTTPQRRVVNLYGRRLDAVSPHISPTVSLQAIGGSPCQPRLMATDPAPYSKTNLHYPSASASSSGMVVHHLPPTHTANALLTHKYVQRDLRDVSPVRSVCCRKDSPMDMHSYSITMENVMQCPNHMESPITKCIKVHPSTMSSQAKVSLQPLQLPISSRVHQQAKLQPRVVPVSCGFQQRFTSQIFSTTNQTMLDKLNSHHVYHMGTSSPTTAPTTNSRIYQQSVGLNSQSPLITSLSPLRNIKYTQASKVYSPHCQMMPYRPRMPVTSPAGPNGSAHRRAAHTIPLSTTIKTNATRTPSNLHQIKVCLPTQSLKIPIAKLRGSRKTSYVKGKLKNLGLQPGTMEPYSAMSTCSQPGQFNLRAGTPTSLLAKVLNLQVKNETDLSCKLSTDGISCTSASGTKPISSAFIGTMRPQPVSSSHKSSTQVQLISVVSSSGHTTDLRSAMSTQTAVVVSPFSVHRNSLIGQPPEPASSCYALTTSSYALSSTAYTIASTNKNCPGFGFTSPTYSVSIATKNNASFPAVGKATAGQSLRKLYTSEKQATGSLSYKLDSEKENATVAYPGKDEREGQEDDSPIEFIVVGTCTTQVSNADHRSSGIGEIQKNACEEPVSAPFQDTQAASVGNESIERNLMDSTEQVVADSKQDEIFDASGEDMKRSTSGLESNDETHNTMLQTLLNQSGKQANKYPSDSQSIPQKPPLKETKSNVSSSTVSDHRRSQANACKKSAKSLKSTSPHNPSGSQVSDKKYSSENPNEAGRFQEKSTSVSVFTDSPASVSDNLYSESETGDNVNDTRVTQSNPKDAPSSAAVGEKKQASVTKSADVTSCITQQRRKSSSDVSVSGPASGAASLDVDRTRPPCDGEADPSVSTDGKCRSRKSDHNSCGDGVSLGASDSSLKSEALGINGKSTKTLSDSACLPVTSARSLLSCKKASRPAGHLKATSDESAASRKEDGSSRTTEQGRKTKKTTTLSDTTSSSAARAEAKTPSSDHAGSGFQANPVTARPVADVTVRPVTDVTVRSVTDVTARPATDGTARPVTDGTVRPVTDGTVRPVTDVTASSVTDVTARPVTDGTARPVTDGTIRPLTDGTNAVSSTPGVNQMAGAQRALRPTPLSDGADPENETSEASHLSSNTSRKRAHYVHEYVPT